MRVQGKVREREDEREREKKFCVEMTGGRKRMEKTKKGTGVEVKRLKEDRKGEGGEVSKIVRP